MKDIILSAEARKLYSIGGGSARPSLDWPVLSKSYASRPASHLLPSGVVYNEFLSLFPKFRMNLSRPWGFNHEGRPEHDPYLQEKSLKLDSEEKEANLPTLRVELYNLASIW